MACFTFDKGDSTLNSSARDIFLNSLIGLFLGMSVVLGLSTNSFAQTRKMPRYSYVQWLRVANKNLAVNRMWVAKRALKKAQWILRYRKTKRGPSILLHDELWFFRLKAKYHACSLKQISGVNMKSLKGKPGQRLFRATLQDFDSNIMHLAGYIRNRQDYLEKRRIVIQKGKLPQQAQLQRSANELAVARNYLSIIKLQKARFSELAKGGQGKGISPKHPKSLPLEKMKDKLANCRKPFTLMSSYRFFRRRHRNLNRRLKGSQVMKVSGNIFLGLGAFAVIFGVINRFRSQEPSLSVGEAGDLVKSGNSFVAMGTAVGVVGGALLLGGFLLAPKKKQTYRVVEKAQRGELLLYR